MQAFLTNIIYTNMLSASITHCHPPTPCNVSQCCRTGRLSFCY